MKWIKPQLAIMLALALAAGDATCEPVLASTSAKRAAPQSLSRGFNFVDAKHGKVHKSELKDWTAAERATVCSAILDARQRAPKLFRSALSIASIRLYREAKPSGKPAVASTACEGILIPDLFFKQPSDYQRHAILHELVHWIDVGHTFSESKRFAGYAQPLIARFQCYEALSSAYAITPRLRKHTIWNDPNAIDDLQEALCEAYVAVRDDDKSPVPPAVAEIVQGIENLSAQDAAAINRIRLAFIQYGYYKFADAKAGLQLGVSRFPDIPNLRKYLAISMVAGGIGERPHEEIESMARLYKNIGVSDQSEEFSRLYLYFVHFVPRLSEIRKDIEQSRKTVKDALFQYDRLVDSGCPTATMALALGDETEESCVLHKIIESGAEQKFVHVLLDDYVNKEYKSYKSLALRGLWAELQGDLHAASALNKQEWYESALKDFENCAELQRTSLDARTSVARLKAKLGRVREADDTYRSLNFVYGGTIQARVLRITIYEMQNRKEEANRELRELLIYRFFRNAKPGFEYDPGERSFGDVA